MKAPREDDQPSQATSEQGESRKQTRRREKAEAKLSHLAESRPDPWERFRILTECIGEARHVIDLSDHRARYALIIVGVLNAALFALLSRAHLIADLPAGVKPWLVGLLVMYGVLTLAFVFSAIESLRPRPLVAGGKGPGGTGPGPLSGLLYWEVVAGQDLEYYHRAWDRVRMIEVTRETETIFHTMSRVVRAKNLALRRLYVGLVALVILAGFLLIITTWLVMR